LVSLKNGPINGYARPFGPLWLKELKLEQSAQVVR